jgi:hypothetical protein
MDAIIQRVTDDIVANAKEIAANPEMTPPQKLCAILMGQGMSEESAKNKEEIIEQFHMPDNAEMHQKSLVQTVKHLAPVIAKIVLQEKEKNVLSSDYPQESVEFFIAAGQFIFDQGLFKWNEEELFRRVMAFIDLMEKTLGVAQGYFDDVKKVFI